MSNVLAFKQKHAETPEATGKGFALIHRQFMDSRLYKDSQAVHLWFHFIMRASHKNSLVETHIGQISVGRGQFITGRPTLVDETGIPDRRIRTLMEKFERMGMISSEPFGRSFSRISVLKYDEYQPENRPIKSLESANETPHAPRLPEQFEPTESQRKAKDNELLTNNSISKDIECPSQTAVQDDDSEIRIPRKPASTDKPKAVHTPYEDMVNAYHEILPEMAGIEVIRGKRKSAMRTFWQQCNREYQKAKGVPFTIENWRNYLEYIATHCTWMMQERPNGKGGFWAAKNLDYLVTDECYTKVKEQRANDRK